jgi:hypothetical protein
MKVNSGDNGVPFHGTVHGVTLNDSGAFGGKLTAWYLPRKYNWQPQVGFELNFTRLTVDLHPPVRGDDGTITTSGFQLGSFGFGFVRDVSVNTLAANLPFRYPVWSTPNFPQGRIASYVDIGVCAQRAALSVQINGHREVSYASAGQVLVGMKFFVMRNLSVFGEDKRIWSSHEFSYSTDIKLTGYNEQWALATIVLVGGVAFHFQEVIRKLYALRSILPADFLFLFFQRLAIDAEGGHGTSFESGIGNLFFAALTDAIGLLVHPIKRLIDLLDQALFALTDTHRKILFGLRRRLIADVRECRLTVWIGEALDRLLQHGLALPLQVTTNSRVLFPLRRCLGSALGSDRLRH